MIKGLTSGLDFVELALIGSNLLSNRGRAIYVIWTNSGSRNAGFAVASLAGAILFFSQRST
jgi:hypothetical protein